MEDAELLQITSHCFSVKDTAPKESLHHTALFSAGVDYLPMAGFLKFFNINGETFALDVRDLEFIRITSENFDANKLAKGLDRKQTREGIEHGVKKDSDGTPSSFSKSKLRILSIDLVHGCTLSCTYCYLSGKQDGKNQFMSKSRFADVLDFFSDIRDNNIIFYFAGGGEPTLNFKLMSEIPDMCNSWGYKNCQYEITTNCTTLTDEMAFFFKDKNFSISVSLDGGKAANAGRLFHDGSESFDTVMRSIERLKTAGVSFTCKSVIQPDNEDLLGSFSFFEDNELPFVFGFATQSFNGSYRPQDVSLTGIRDQMVGLLNYYSSKIKLNKKVYSTKIINDIKRIHFGAISEYACNALRQGLFVDIVGDIYSCSCHNSSKELSIGSIYSGIDFDKAEKSGFYAKTVEKYPSCKGCWMKRLCAGSCMAVKWLETGSVDTPSKYLCEFNDIYWSFIINLYVSVHNELESGKNVNFA